MAAGRVREHAERSGSIRGQPALRLCIRGRRDRQMASVSGRSRETVLTGPRRSRAANRSEVERGGFLDAVRCARAAARTSPGRVWNRLATNASGPQAARASDARRSAGSGRSSVAERTAYPVATAPGKCLSIASRVRSSVSKGDYPERLTVAGVPGSVFPSAMRVRKPDAVQREEDFQGSPQWISPGRRACSRCQASLAGRSDG